MVRILRTKRIIVDQQNPFVEITSPTTSTSYSTSESLLIVSGTASDDIALDRIEYSLSGDTTGSGTCTGTTSWTTGELSYNVGSTVVTITAYDQTGKTSTDVLNVEVGLVGNIAVGTTKNFSSVDMLGSSITRLSDTKLLVAYANSMTNAYVQILTVSGSTISQGSKYTFNGQWTSSITVSAFSDTYAVVCYNNGTNSTGYAKPLTVSGTSITVGSVVTVDSNMSVGRVVALDDTKALIAYYDANSTNKGACRCITRSGSSISIGAQMNFNNYKIVDLSIDKLDSTHAIVTYSEDTDSDLLGERLRACVLTLSGTTVTSGTELNVTNGTINRTAVATISNDKAVLCYRDADNSNYGYSCVLSISGTTVTSGTLFNYYSSAIFDSLSAICIAKINSTRALVSSRNSSTGSGVAICLKVDGTTLTKGPSDTVYNSGYTGYTDISSLNSTQAAVVYRNGNISNYGCGNVLTVS